MTWFRARLRWAVMAGEGEGLRHWEEADCFFCSVDWDTAFARALSIGRDRQRAHDEDTQYVETRLAAVVTLDCLGDDPEVLEGRTVSIPPAAPVQFDHVFRPEEAIPPPSF